MEHETRNSLDIDRPSGQNDANLQPSKDVLDCLYKNFGK